MATANHFHAVSPELVHKSAAAEALVSAVAADQDGWILRTRLPGHHDFHSDSIGRQSGYHDPLLVLEAFRQGCIAASHLFCGVPLDFRYTVRFYELSVLDFTALEHDTGPAEFDFHTEIRSEFRPEPQAAVNGLAVAATATRNGSRAMELGGSFGWMPESRWQRMRTGSSWEPGPQPPTTDPLAVGRTQSAHVVIGGPVQSHDDGSACAPIVVDTGNPTFFDHPLDHLPGGLILEACRQLAVSVLGPRASTVVGPSRLRCDFESFAELNPPCVVRLAPAGAALTFGAQIDQSGHARARVGLTFAGQDSST
jgi:hypothetical protein